MKNDPILDEMAQELHDQLVSRGLDPKHPPQGPAPSKAVWDEYERRGGSVYGTKDAVAKSLVERVKSI